ncbi:MAG TPA: YraN family protein [Chloroflexota bacterium]|jgi:putative endonuclease|nr:YraN family protein [Chloroflexota bacterium]
MKGRSLGDHGEQLAVDFLGQRGYQIVARNQRLLWGEIDVIAREGADLVFLEIKTRHAGASVGPEQAMTRNKLHRVEKLAMAYLDEHGLEAGSWRVEVVSIETAPDGAPLRLELHQNLS